MGLSKLCSSTEGRDLHLPEKTAEAFCVEGGLCYEESGMGHTVSKQSGEHWWCARSCCLYISAEVGGGKQCLSVLFFLEKSVNTPASPTQALKLVKNK